jgi:hypothetical protein
LFTTQASCGRKAISSSHASDDFLKVLQQTQIKPCTRLVTDHVNSEARASSCLPGQFWGKIGTKQDAGYPKNVQDRTPACGGEDLALQECFEVGLTI